MIKTSIRKIIDLIIIFLKDSYQNIDIFNFKTYKMNRKSIFLWMILILVVALLLISDSTIKFLVTRGQSEVFLNVYFLILAIIMLFQTILVCTNIFYFSKDLEFVLPLPIHPVELLISKYGTLICKLYISEMIFGLIPMIIYGIRTDSSPVFYILLLMIFLVFPIFLSLIISMVMMFVMKISRFIKNKDLFQLIITFMLMAVLLGIEYNVMGNILINDANEIQFIEENKALEKIEEINNKIIEGNKYFIVINPSVDALKKCDFTSILQILKLTVINSITFIVFIFIGKKTYLKDILKNTAYLLNNQNKKTNLQKKCKKKSIKNAYIFKEFKSLFRNPMFFMQCVYPVISWLTTIVIIAIMIVPKIEMAMANEEIRQSLGDISFDITAVFFIIGLIQLLFMTSTASLTAVSREGKNATFMKQIPVSLYKQFIYKGIPQMFINTFSILVILGAVWYAVPSISWNYIIYMFLIAMLLNIINSQSMLIIDFIRPKLNWDTEYAVLKQNNNKIFQYVFTVLIICILMYLEKALKGVNLDIALIITNIVFAAIIVVINTFVYKKQDKLYKNII